MVKYKFGKLGKYRFMNGYGRISASLPDTRAATKSNINTMLRLYDSVYLKPDTGTGGHGIYKLTKNAKRYTLRSGSISKQFDSLDTLFRSLHKLQLKNKYVAQRGIGLLRHSNRPFDIRVMVQKNRSKQLEVTGIIGRMAKPRKIVTNYHSGGTPLPVEILLKSHLNGIKRLKYIKKIELLGKDASVVLAKGYPKNKAFGVDIAIDSELKLWVLEVNTKPDMSIFNTLSNKTMYRKILKFSKLNG
ncbi:YheC/YheD family protein [Bacillus sp. FJAT-28004]|uniref:YheC/YheD family protein n=1 Tax=Bacillus sp. FJAT-28004 TaxID=1679165 RepID=UPI0007C79093|nr:YheC/YheD family protein [Bacillus sp. FJAT-28004]